MLLKDTSGKHEVLVSFCLFCFVVVVVPENPYHCPWEKVRAITFLCRIPMEVQMNGPFHLNTHSENDPGH